MHDIIDGFRLSGSGGAFAAGKDDEPAYAALFSMLRHNAEMVKVRTASGQIFTADVYEEVAPRALLGGALAGVGGGGGEGDGGGGGGGDGDDAGEERGPDAIGFEGAPASALDRIEAFLQLSRRELRAERDALEKMLWAGGGREPRRLEWPKQRVFVFFPLCFLAIFFGNYSPHALAGGNFLVFSLHRLFPERKKKIERRVCDIQARDSGWRTTP